MELSYSNIKNARYGIIAFLTVILMTLSFFFSVPMNAYAASVGDRMTVGSIGEYPPAGSNMHYWATADGTPLFCADAYNRNHAGTGHGGTIIDVSSLSAGYSARQRHMIDYIIYYATKASKEGLTYYGVSGYQLQRAAQFALWGVRQGYNGSIPYSQNGSSQVAFNAGRGFYNDAVAYADGGNYKSEIEGCAVGFRPDGGLQEMFFLGTQPGTVKLKKSSAAPNISDNNPCYDLAGAVYTVYNGSNEVVGTLTTDSNGDSNELQLPAGSYWYKETTAPKGYGLNADAHSFTVETSKLTSLSDSDTPGNDPVYMRVRKVDANTGLTTPQGDASLENAKFRIEYWNAANADTTTAPARTWNIKTGNDGAAFLERESLIDNSDALFTDPAGNVTIPYGTIRVTEYSAPTGYTAAEKSWTWNINPDEHAGAMTVDVIPNETNVDEKVQKGGAIWYKADTETHTVGTGLNGATLEGTEFNLVNRSVNPVAVDVNQDGNIDKDSEVFATGQTIQTLKADANGVVKTPEDYLPYGTYEISESKAARGYTLADTTKTFQIREDHQVVDLNNDHFENHIIRGDFKFNKVDANSGNAMKNVAFLITSKTTGEKHVVVTDENGMVDTSSSWVKHTENTNANDAALNADGTIDETKLVKGAGVYFSGTADGHALTPNDDFGAIPFGDYTIEEIPTSANTGKGMITRDFTISRDGVNLDFGAIDNHDIEIHTTAEDGPSGTENGTNAQNINIVDHVMYTNLTPGKEYTMTGTLMDKDTNEAVLDADGNPVTASTVFTPTSPNGTVDVTFNFKSDGIYNKTTVVFEDLYQNGRKLATHADINDRPQQVTFKSTIGTLAHDGSKKVIKIDEHSKFVDTVSYKNLVPGKEYTLEATVVDHDGNPILVNGQEIKVTKTFTPETQDGTVDVEFDVDTRELANKDMTVFETLKFKDTIVAEHKDPKDKDQTVSVAKAIKTVLHGTDGVKLIEPDENGNANITDTISYENLEPGQTYVITGVLMDTDTGKVINANNNTVTVKFTPKEKDGTVDINFNINASQLRGKNVTAFETCKLGNEVVAEHKDINDKDQTVRISAEIHTTATDKADGDKTMASDGTVTIVDKVQYKGLVPGTEYTMTGMLVKSGTGEELGIDGSKQTVKFTPTSPDGTVDVEFTVDASQLAGESVTAFESCSISSTNEIVGEHKNPNDKGQTVEFEKPKGKSYPKTGNPLAGAWMMFAALGTLSGVATAYSFAKNKKENK